MAGLDQYRVEPGEKAHLHKRDTKDNGGMEKAERLAELEKLKERMFDLQKVLYAQNQQAILFVLQAMDTGGKDGTIRGVFTAFNPQGCRVVSYKQPNETERHHDFLWRIHENTPHLGSITVFNRSHYEDVLIVRVKNLVPEERWKGRYDHINHFEKLLHDEKTRIVKFFLHISKDYQKERLQRRLDNKDKNWKFSPSDVAERQYWDDYQVAYEEALSRCSTAHAPWYVIPAESHSFRDLLVARIVVQTMESMKLSYPKVDFDPKKIVVI